MLSSPVQDCTFEITDITLQYEYMSYMERKTHKRQTTIVTLSDQNTKEIQDIREQKEKMLASYEEKKAKLRAIMLDKEATLAKTKQELEDLAEYRVSYCLKIFSQ